ncbi:hypothetical protein [Nocardiopsis lambiniae]|uniref:DUF1508 domain-containing protein n=1 Tax=Nocardiopsis lambiniae TaxID=3075539 RepID=A0ABU2MH84_9ACTN|nr:hypothetical protein [Nocardiopsis sp. DSM 44743]MDT0332058.1 hypothetical protein [Nocardiopsis sp. DSM 44743]
MSTGEEDRLRGDGPTAPDAPYGCPPLEEDEPDVRLSRRDPLFPHEFLAGWRHPDGEWHWRYHAELGERSFTIRMTAEADVPVEEMAERIRGVAVLGETS